MLRTRRALVALVATAAASGLAAAPGAATSGAAEKSSGSGWGATADACGEQPPKADGTLWECTFADDFEGDTLDRSKWIPQTQFESGERGALACYVDDPANVAVADGHLLLTTRKVSPEQACHDGASQASTPYTSGMVSTYYLFSQRYGRFEARIKSAETDQPGLQEAFWLWPDVREGYGVWPAAGEIDIAETYSQHPQLAIPFLHYTWNDNGGPRQGLNTQYCAAERGEFNTYTLVWSAERLEIFVNGTSCLVNTSGDRAFQKKYIVALTSMLGSGANAYTGAAPLPATMAIDYVRVWK